MTDNKMKYFLLKRKVVNKVRSTNISKIAEYMTILGVIVATYFAWLTVNLTRKYGESKDQINRLDTMVNKQQASIDTLVDILKELRTQNGYAKEQTSELKSQGREIFDQTQSVSRQLAISQQQQRISNKLNLISNKADRNTFRNVFYKITDLWQDFFHDLNGSDPLSAPDSYNDFLKRLKITVQSQFTNSYLLQDDTLQKKWIKFDTQISNCISVLNLNSDFHSDIVIDGQKSLTPDSLYTDKYKHQWFTAFRSQYENFWASTAMKLMNDKELLYQK